MGMGQAEWSKIMEGNTARARNEDRCTYSHRIPSVRLSVTFLYFVQSKEHTIMRFSASGRIIHLVSGEIKFILIFAWDNPQRGR